MITYTTNSIFSSVADAIVCPVNTVGVMGAGLAKQFAWRYPELKAEYAARCANGSLKIGSLFVWRIHEPHRETSVNPRYVVCLPTKRHWRYPSKLSYVVTGLGLFVEGYSQYGITSAAFPKLGCGLGNLEWENALHVNEVKGVMEHHLGNLPIPITIHLV